MTRTSVQLKGGNSNTHNRAYYLLLLTCAFSAKKMQLLGDSKGNKELLEASYTYPVCEDKVYLNGHLLFTISGEVAFCCYETSQCNPLVWMTVLK